MDFAAVLREARIVPVVVLDDAGDAVPLARALVAGGLPVIEVTFRTAAAAESIRRIVAEVPDAVTGAGTVISPEQVDAAVEAGARFLVSPGFLPEVAARAAAAGVPLFPGVATGSEIMAALASGLSILKLFPAGVVGGPKAIAAFSGPFPQVRFMPTGGVSEANLGEYLGMEAVLAVGGTWMVGKDLIREGRWDEVTRLARAAVERAKEARS